MKIDDNVNALLGTLQICVQLDNQTQSMPIRGFLDNGSQVNLISEYAVQMLHLCRKRTKIPIGGIGTTTIANGVVNITVTNRNDHTKSIQLQAYVVPRITGRMPDRKFDSPFKSSIDDCDLADPSYNRPGEINMLLGVGVWAAIIEPNILRSKINDDIIVAQSTLLGYVIGGHVPIACHIRLRSCHILEEIEDAKIDQWLVRQWNADTIPKQRQWTAEEQHAETVFVSTHRRDPSGRYIVNIPLRTDAKPLGNSYNHARAVFKSIERKLHREPQLLAQYKAVFDDYRSKGHMVLASQRPINDADVYYMPHHAINASSTNTKGKFRVVFNASAETTNGVSYNSQQLPGPKLQDDLITMFMRFRAHRFAMTADMVQMFRQVKVAPEFWNFQRVLWRDNPSDELLEYIITVVCWGQTSAGFNAVRAVRQLAVDEQTRYPIGAQLALNDLYYDDMLSGAATDDELIIKYQQINQLLAAGGFKLSKWASNSQQLQAMIRQDSQQAETDIAFDTGVLGMRWHTKTDTINIRIRENIFVAADDPTKRSVLSATSKVFDPIGFVLPVVVCGKILQQDIWRAGIGWDEPLSQPLIEQWNEYARNIPMLDQIQVPRWMQTNPSDKIELHIFTDSSEKAMGAVGYFRVMKPDGSFHVAILQARSRIVPIKKVTIPRLELCAAVLGAELAQHIRSSFKCENIDTYFWTDSTIVLCWIKKEPSLLKDYIANRVTLIRGAGGVWQHVDGTQNPADLLTRGISVDQLKSCTLWWHGPPWLLKSTDEWPRAAALSIPSELFGLVQDENKPNASNHATIEGRSRKGKPMVMLIQKQNNGIGVQNASGEHEPLINRFSNLASLLRATSFVFRFIENVRRAIAKRKSTKEIRQHTTIVPCDRTLIRAVNNVERKQALMYWIKYSQNIFYSEEIRTLDNKQQVLSNSSIIKLHPVIGDDGLLRVGGRLANANIPEGTKHQIILSPHARLSGLLIREAHAITIHGGPQLMMAHLRKQFWIPRMRQIIGSYTRKCPSCARFNQQPNDQLMGSLPASRITEAEPFLRTGLDFAGPFNIRRNKGRPPTIERCSKEPKAPMMKAWIVIFVCLVTRAVHLDVVVGLTIEEFLAVFERFTMRKGRCIELLSDNGTTFVGSDKELAKTLQHWSKQLPEHNLAKFGTTWNFQTPASPFRGGIFEKAVGCFKRHLKPAIGVKILTREELYHIAVTIEGCLNSRPLWPLSDDPNDPLPLTPAHFILAKPILPQPVVEDVADIPVNRLTMWGQRQKIIQQIWKRWQEEYLAEKQVRTKWYKIRENLKIGDMVIIRRENMPPALWCIGRVIEVYRGKDNLIRTVRVKTPTGELERPINKLVFLPQPDQNSG